MCVVRFQAASGGWCPAVRSGEGWNMSTTHEGRGEGEGGRGVGPRVPTPSPPHPNVPILLPPNPNAPIPSPPNPKLLTILRSKLRVGHYSRRTEQAYVSWTRRFVRHHGLVHPAELAEREVVSFLRHLAEDRHVAQATQAQALAALQFLYQHVLGRPLQLEGRLPRARTPKRLPVVLSRTEVVRVLAQLRGVYAMIGLLLYGSGMRLMECLTLRIKDVDLERGEIRIRRGKGGVDRVTGTTAERACCADWSPRAGAGAASRGPGGGWRTCAASGCPRSEAAQGWTGVAVAVTLSGHAALAERFQRGAWPASSGSFRGTAGDGGRGPSFRHWEAGDVSHASAQLRDASAGVGIRHPDGAGVIGTPRCEHDDGVYARAESRWAWCSESSGFVGRHRPRSLFRFGGWW